METIDQKAIIEKEVAFAMKREIPFTESGMRSFSNVNSAIKYFRSMKQPRSIKSIIWLWQQSFEVNAGSVSVLVFDYKSNPESMKKRLETLLKSETQRKSFDKSFKIWMEKLDGINRISETDAKRIMMETKTLEP